MAPKPLPELKHKLKQMVTLTLKKSTTELLQKLSHCPRVKFNGVFVSVPF